jgi:translocation and assembly module TamB
LKKSLRIAGISLGALLLLVASFVLWMLHTESGARAALALARPWIPSGLSYRALQGSIAGPLRITGFRYQDPAIALDLSVENATVDVAIFSFLAKRLRIERADIDGVTLVFSPSETPPSPDPRVPRDPWVAPLDMQFDEVHLTRAELRWPDAVPLLVSRLELAASWIGADIEARKLELESPDGQVSLSARLGAQSPKLRGLDARFRWRHGEHQWAGTLGARGDRANLALDAALTSPVHAALKGALAPVRAGSSRDGWSVQLSVPEFDPRPLVDTEAFDRVALELDAEGNTRDLALNGVLTLGKDRIHLEELLLARREQRLEVTSLRARLNAEPAAVTGSAKLVLDGSKAASAQLAWEEFRLPDAWAGANFRCSGQVALTASGERFAAHSSMRLARAQRYSTLSLRVNGTKESLDITELELTQTPGSLSIAGQVDLGTPLRWQLKSQARAFDPSLFSDAWPGALDFDLESTGHWAESGPSARFKLASLDGKLRGRAITGSGDISLGRDLRPSGSLKLKSGGAAFEAVAAATPQARVDANLRIAELEEWRKDVQGALNASVVALGRWPAIQVQGHFEASRLRGAGVNVDAARLDLDGADVRAPQGTAKLSARGLSLAGFSFDELEASLEGNQAAHELKLSARGTPLSLVLGTHGGFERGGWVGQVQDLRLDIDKVPPLSLQQPVKLAVARDSLSLDNACLAGGDMSLCASANRRQEVAEIHYSIRALPLNLIQALAAPESVATVEGLLEGAGELRRASDGSLSGQASLTSAKGLLAQEGSDDSVRLEYRDFKLEANLARETGVARVHGTLVGQGELDGEMNIAVRETDPSLNGKATLELKDLAPLAWWVPQLAKLQGKGNLSAEVSGTLAAPRFAFTVAASEVDTEIPLLGLHLHEGNFTAKLNHDGSFDATGGIRSGDGELRIIGTQASGGMAIKLQGSKFLAANTPGARVIIAPDLTLTGKPGALALNGAVTIEEAEVNLEKLTFARSYSTSPDVVIVDREQEIRNRSLGLTTDVRILLGKDVKLAGYGLESTVAGELRVTEEPGEASRAIGEILVAGTYEAFGRKLAIERGRLQYAGTALDDPQLDILASRKLEDVTAKLRVTGTAQKPKLDVFTDPAMSQTDAMSYLLTGKPASDLHGEDGAAVQNAAQSLGSVVLGNRLLRKFGGKAGLVDEVGVEQNSDLGGSAFTVGKYLSPRLFVSYGVGLFEPGNAITVRWQFSERWSLEANDSPEDQHAGIRYRIEK